MLEDLRTCRATTFLGVSWVVIFVAMHLAQGFGLTQGPPPSAQTLGFGQVSVETAQLFGALRWPDFLKGQVWRLVTATFVHFNVLHLLMNLLGLMQLGWLMEPWYGSRQFLTIMVAIGGFGNLCGGLLRQAFYQIRAAVEAGGMGRMLPEFLRNGGAPGVGVPVTSGGGSTIILGLIGLAMIVGWRSRTRVGMFLRDQMIGFLVFTGILGIVLAKLVDNYGHLGGTIAGIGVGFLHRRLVRTAEVLLVRRVAGVLTVGILIACFVAQGVASVREIDRSRRQSRTLAEGAQLFRRGQAAVALLSDIERLDQGLSRMAVLKEPLGIPEIDWPEPLGRVGPTRPPTLATTIQARDQARNLITSALAAIKQVRPVLDADLADENLDQIIDIAQKATAQPLLARELYTFQTLGRDLVKKAHERQSELARRFEAMGLQVQNSTP